jgi:mannosyltransferase
VSLFVTNFNRNYTGVSSTAASVCSLQKDLMPLELVGQPLPNCPAPITLLEAYRKSGRRPKDVPFAIWHVRRNNEMAAAIFARDVLRLPIRIVFTSAAQRRHSAYPRLLISKMDAIIATTEAAAGYFPSVAAVAPHGVDTRRFSPAQDREIAWKQTGFPGKLGIAAVGRIRPEKGTDRFVATMIEVLPLVPGATALVVGKATKEHETFLATLKSDVHKAGLENRILFPGEIPPEKASEIFRSISLLAAFPKYEGYGMTPLEAMASGTPFVGTDAGYFKSFCGGGEAGAIIEPWTLEPAVKAVLALLQDKETHERCSRGALNRARSLFSIETEVSTINSVYRQLWDKG